MSTQWKSILTSIKAAFEALAPAPAPAPAPAAPAATGNTKVHKTTDGKELTITQAGDAPAAGDTVMIAGAPAPAGTYILEDNSSITCDAAGVITAVVIPEPVMTESQAAPAAPAAAPPAPAPAPAKQFQAFTIPDNQEQLEALLQKFATGEPGDRIANLEMCVKACMEYCFGWKITEAARVASENAAIEVYKTELKGVTTQLNSQKDLFGQLLQIVTEMAELPTADPKTLTGEKKEKFDKAKAKEDRLDKIAEGMRALREEAKA